MGIGQRGVDEPSSGHDETRYQLNDQRIFPTLNSSENDVKRREKWQEESENGREDTSSASHADLIRDKQMGDDARRLEAKTYPHSPLAVNKYIQSRVLGPNTSKQSFCRRCVVVVTIAMTAAETNQHAS